MYRYTCNQLRNGMAPASKRGRIRCSLSSFHLPQTILSRYYFLSVSFIVKIYHSSKWSLGLFTRRSISLFLFSAIFSNSAKAIETPAYNGISITYSCTETTPLTGNEKKNKRSEFYALLSEAVKMLLFHSLPYSRKMSDNISYELCIHSLARSRALSHSVCNLFSE